MIEHPKARSGGEARSVAEARFAVTLEPCPSCGVRTTEERPWLAGAIQLDVYRDGRACSLSGRCPSCNAVRTLGVMLDADQERPRDRLELGGPEPSQIIERSAFEAELARLAPFLADVDLESLDPEAWSNASRMNDRGVTTVRELCKFPDVDARYLAERDRLNARADSFRADAPRIWLVKDQGRFGLEAEIRGVLNQITKPKLPRAADFERYLAVRARGQSGEVERVRVFDEGDRTTIELTVARGTRDDVKSALFPQPADRVVVEGHPIIVEVDGEGSTVRRVMLTWVHPPPDWFLHEEMSSKPPRRTRSVHSDFVSRTCAACGSQVSVEIPWLESKSPPLEPSASGVDGRPSYRDSDLGGDVRLLEEQELRLETCPRCDHVAPRVDIPFPHIDAARARREALASVGEYGRTALRYIYVSALYGDADPHRQAVWLLRAAWAAEAMGLAKYGGHLRRFAATLFEESLAGGVGVETYRGGTSLVMSELYRVSGDFERAAQHCRRGLIAVHAEPKAFSDVVRVSLLAEAERIVSRRREVLRRQTVTDEWPTILRPRISEILAALEAVCPVPPPLRHAELRRFYHQGTSSLTAERVAFAEDFLDEDRLIPHLRAGGDGVWEALCVRPRLLAPLLLATDHGEVFVRNHAMAALYDHRLPFPPSVLDGRTDAVDALSRRLFDDDDETVCRAGAILQQVARLSPAFAGRIQQAAQAALTERAHDLSAQGVLERLGASAVVTDLVEEAIARLRDGDPRTRGEAAMWLATNGDARAFAALEHAAIWDKDTYDGGRDTDESVEHDALYAMRALRRRAIVPTPADVERVGELITVSPALGEFLETLVELYGEAMSPVVMQATKHERPAVRFRAQMILQRFEARRRGEPSPIPDPFASEDEEVRLEAAKESRNGRRMVDRLPLEPSPRVRRAIAEHWVKVCEQSGRTDTAAAFEMLSRDDPATRSVVAAHILGTTLTRTTGMGGKYLHPSEQDSEALRDLAREVIEGRRPARPSVAPAPAPPEAPTTPAGPRHPLRALMEQRATELDRLESEAVASGKQRFSASHFRTLGDFGDATSDHYRWGYYLEPAYRRMEDYAAFLNSIEAWKDTS